MKTSREHVMARARARHAAPGISPSTPHRILRAAFGAITMLVLASAAPAALAATEASAGASSAYGLAVEATLDLPLLPDVTVTVGPLPAGVAGTAPPDYNLGDSTASASAVLGTLGSIVSTGVLNASASSNLAANLTNASASVDQLLVNIDPLVGAAVLNLTALTVASTAQASCTAGGITLSGTTTLENAQATIGELAAVGLDANPAPNTVVPVVGIAGLSIILNEQIATAKEITVNAIHISFLNLAVGPDLLSGDIIVSQSVASLENCSGGAIPDLSIDKVHTGNFTQGQVGAQYSISVSNIGAAPTAGTVTVTDTLPAGFTATAIGGTGWSCTLATLTCTRADSLAGGSSYPVITLTVDVAANATSPQDNMVTVAGGGDGSPGNNTDIDPTIIDGAPAAPDLTLTKTHTGNFTQGQVGAQYTITVSNVGTAATSGTVTVTDALPGGLTATAISGLGWSCDLPSLTCTRSDALAGSASYPAIILVVNVAADATSPQDNVVTVTGGGDGSPGNNSDTDSTIIEGTPLAPDLTLIKSHAGNFSQGQVGAQYTITVSNVGTAPTAGVVTVTDALPAGLTATAISGTGWSCTLATLTCTRADALAAGESYPAITLTVDVASNATSPQDNTVAVSGGGDTSPGNNSDTDSTVIDGAPAAPDLTLDKTHTGNFTQGQVGAQYTITVTNTGSGASTGTVTVTDALPAAFTATAISGSGWDCTLATLACTRADALAGGASYPAITLTVNVAANATSPQENVVTVTGGGDTSPGNNSDTDTTLVDGAAGAPDLTIAKTHTGNFTQGQVGAQYAISVSNVGTGPSAGTVTVTDGLPPGFTATAIAGTGWTCDLGSLTCTRSDALAAGFSYPVITLTVNVAGNATSPQDNVVTVTGGSDTTPGNNSDTDTTVIDGAPAAPDLTINKTHTGNFTQGQVGAQYTITVSNVGGGATSGTVTVTDTLPAGLTATAIAGSGWSCTLGTLSCTRSDALAAGASYPAITLTVNVAANASSSVVNSVVVSGGNDNTPGNNSDTDTTTVTQGGAPNLTLSKSHQGTFVLGQTGATYTLTVSNSGTGPTVGTVTVVDTPPTGYTATSMNGSGWTCSVATTTCTRSDALAAGASYPPIILVGNIASNAGSPLVNVAVVLGGGETTTDDNSDSDTTVLGGVPAPITVPTLGHFGLLLMGLVMLLAGLAARRSRGPAG